jgi:hypothetical protein
MATKKASALKAFITGIVCIIMIGLGWLSDALIANGQTGGISKLLAWLSLAAAAVALLVAICFTFRALAIREPQKESDLEFEEESNGENPKLNRFFDH